MNLRPTTRILAVLAMLGWLAAHAADAPHTMAFDHGGLAPASGQSPEADAAQMPTARFSAEVTGFLSREIAAHVAAVERTDPPQPMVLGVPTGGDFTWGSFMRALTECSALAGTRTVAGRDVPALLGQLGLIEARQGGKTFAQLYSALALRQFGTTLRDNALWQSLTPPQQAEWRSLLDPARFYNRQTRQVIDLPENYLGVASRITAIGFQTGLITDRAFVDDVLDAAAGQFLRGERYTDDALPTGRYDRYSQEYARFVYLAAKDVGRQDIVAAVSPALTAVMKTWWALASPDGYGYPWGRTIGAISYMDTMEIVGFLAAHPEFRPAPLPELASVYAAAWRWLQRDYQADRHLLNMFGFGRGKVVFLYNLLDLKRTTWEGPELEAGKHTIVFDFKPDGPGLAKGGTGVLSVDGQEVAKNTLNHTTPITFPEDETFDVGLDTRTPLALIEYRYDVPFKFTGTINKLTFNLGPDQLTAEEREQMQKTVARARD